MMRLGTQASTSKRAGLTAMSIRSRKKWEAEKLRARKAAKLSADNAVFRLMDGWCNYKKKTRGSWRSLVSGDA